MANKNLDTVILFIWLTGILGIIYFTLRAISESEEQAMQEQLHMTHEHQQVGNVYVPK